MLFLYKFMDEFDLWFFFVSGLQLVVDVVLYMILSIGKVVGMLFGMFFDLNVGLLIVDINVMKWC